MCPPLIAAIPAVIAAASATVGFMGKKQAAQANETAANLGRANYEQESGVRSVYTDRQQAENNLEAAINRQSLRGRISASASALGATGGSTATMANAADVQVGRSMGIADLGSEQQRLSSAFGMNAADFRRQSQIASVPPPSPVAFALDLADAGLKGYNSYTKMTAPEGA